MAPRGPSLASLECVPDVSDATSDDEFLVLHGLRMKGMASPDVIEQSDSNYDQECISALEDVHGRFLPLVMRAARAAPHFDGYLPRLRQAIEKLTDDGDLDYFTKPLIDSYHTVWFEFHEDLIATL